MLKKISFGLVAFGFATQVMAAPLTMGQIYNYAKKGDMQSLRKVAKHIDSVGKDGNTNLCRAVYNNDYKAFNALKTAGASVQHACVKKIPAEKIKAFNEGYANWAKGMNASAKVATGTTTAGTVATTTGLSTGAMVGIGVGAVALIGGGIALAAGGGGGGGSSPSCKTGYFLQDGNCEPNDCTGYDLNSCPIGANCSQCQSGENLKYTFNGCQIGYTQSGDSCTVNACTGYDLTSCPVNATGCSTCQSGSTRKYKVNGCKTGWEGDTCSTPTSCPYNTTSCGQGYHETGNTCQSGNTIYIECASNDCTDYELNSCPTGGNCSKCQSGEVEKYKLDSCQSGYTQNGDTCTANVCSGSTSHVANCEAETSCTSPTGTYYTCTTCNNGYTLSGNTCTANACTEYDLTSCPVNATGCSECQSGSTRKYKVNGCKTGWEGDTCSTPTSCPYNTTSCGQGYHETGNTCQSGDRVYKECASNDCTDYELNSCPTGGNCSKCQSGEVEKYKLDSCQSGYTQNGDTCEPNVCSGSTSRVANCEVETSCTSPTGTYYTCTTCNNGYTLSGNTCTPNACTEYDLTSCPVNATGCSECQSGETTKYKINGCKTGWTGDDCSIQGTNCPANTYGIDDVCFACPANSTAPAGSDSIDDCACENGYEKIGSACFLKNTEKDYVKITATEFNSGDTNYKSGRFLPIINAGSAYEKFIRVIKDDKNKITDYDFSGLSEVRIAVMDTGVNPANENINFAMDENGNQLQFDYATPTSSGSGYHGTAVAGLISSKWDTSRTTNQINGVAPNATIVDWMIDKTGNCDIAGDCTGMTWDTLNSVSATNPRIYNLSWSFFGYTGNKDKYRFADTYDYIPTGQSSTNFDLSFTQDSFWNAFLSTLADNNSVLVLSSANDGQSTNTQLLSAAPLTSSWGKGSDHDLTNLLIVAVALDMNTTSTVSGSSNISGQADYSNGCGVAAKYCLSAPAGDATSDGTEITQDTRLNSTGFTTNTLKKFNGTSAAAPIISGSLAFVMGAYPYLTSQQATEILFRSANKSFTGWSNSKNVKSDWTDSFGNVYKVGTMFGHGLIDLGAATEPLGIMSLPTSTASVTSMGDLNAISKAPMSETKLALPRVLNRSLSVALPETIMGLDDYNRPFAVKTGNLITQAHRTDESFRRHFKSFMNRTHRTLTGVPDKMSFEFSSSQTDDNLLGMGVLDINYRFNDTVGMKFSYRSDMIDEEKHFDRALANPFLNMTDSYGLTQEFNLNKNFTFKVGTILGKNGFYRGDEDLDEEYNRSVHAFTTEADYKINNALTLKVIGGMLSETDAALGINGTGALNTDTSKTYFTGSVIEYYPIEGLTLSASYYYGQTQVPNSDSLVSFGDLISDGFALDARYQLDKNKMFGLQFSSPLRIRKGMATLNIPVARDLYSDTVYYDTVRVGLKPSAREYDIGLYYAQETENYDWRGELMTRFNPDHISGIKPDYRALFGLSLKY